MRITHSKLLKYGFEEYEKGYWSYSRDLVSIEYHEPSQELISGHSNVYPVDSNKLDKVMKAIFEFELVFLYE